MNLTSGTLLERGKYRIISTLGRGGFGITYLAEQVLARRKVCIKEFFPKDFFKRDEGSDSISILSQGHASTMLRFKEKFLKEAQTIAALDHANIIPIYDVFEENNTAYYVMEYIDGESLSDVIKRRGALAESEAVDYICQAASALEYLHDRRIMHLDVKPGNIMVRRKDNRVVLIDFGLSKHYDEQSGEATSTTPVGVSHGYAPLEQYKQGGVSTFSPETDIYSLGATLYCLLTGQRPPEAASLINDPLEFPQQVSATLRSAITAAMSPSSKQRPASVGKFVAMFNKAD
ncbi:MAG: serine/threonine protein kinase, partial [Alistipes sp.]|nr:serine/threonine protein kinase [Alistipes sp.]